MRENVRSRKTNTSTTAEVFDEREGATGETEQEAAEVTPHGLAGDSASGKSVVPGKASKKRGIRATTVREKNSSQAQEKIDRLMKLAAETSQFLTEHGKEDHDVCFSLVILNKVTRSKSTGGFHSDGDRMVIYGRQVRFVIRCYYHQGVAGVCI